MAIRTIVCYAILLWCFVTEFRSIYADNIFFDDFLDGSIDNELPLMHDGTPVRWLPNQSELEVQNNQLIVANPFMLETHFSLAEVEGLIITDDISIRSRVELVTGRTIGIEAREHWVVLNETGRLAIGKTENGNPIERVETQFNPTTNDLFMQYDIFDETFSVWVWDPDDRMPLEPTLSIVDEEPGNGNNSIQVGGTSDKPWPEPGRYEGIFHFVQVADTHIVTGDSNQNGVLDTNDITELSAAIRRGEKHAIYDLNGDDSVNSDDRIRWVKLESNTWFGDANLDGEFNSADLVAVFQAGEYEDDITMNSGWATGDWNGDAEFNTADLVLAFQDGGYELGPRNVANLVPEPSISPFLGVVYFVVLFAFRMSRIERIGGKRV